MMIAAPLLIFAILQGYGGAGYGQPETKAAQVRAINAVPELQLADLTIGSASWRSVPYGQRTEYAPVSTQKATASLAGQRGQRVANEVPVQLQPAYPHTIVFCGSPVTHGKFTPIIVRDSTAGRPSASSTQMLFVNALSDGAPVVIKLDGKPLNKFPVLNFAAQTGVIGFSPKELQVTLEDTSGKALFSTTFRALAGTRYTAVVMGVASGAGLRAPRIYFYSF
jgi:hypothetical protein